MKFEAKTSYTEDLINEAAMIYWKKVFARTFVISFCGIILALALILYFNSKDWISGSFLAISIILSLLSIGAFFVYRNRSMAIFRELETPVVRWKFNTDYISTESDVGKSEFRWSLLSGIIKSNKIWLLVFKNNPYSVFPVKNISDEVLTFLSNKVKEHGGKIT